ncbi:MAG: flagellar export protein FliJ [Deltaproteobacteria bacterium]|nr:flagellar export protein FliJ [Deltaproteobacteria bacterium]
MKKFVFKLEPLLDYRKRLEEISLKEFSVALRTLDEEEGKLVLLNEMCRRSSEDIDRLKEEGAGADDFNMHYLYITGLKSHIKGQEAIIKAVRAEFEAKRAELIEATRKKKVVETIKGKNLHEHMRMFEKEEQKTTDDITSSRFKRGGGE